MQCKNSKNFLVLSVAQGNAVALLYSDWGYKLPVWRKRATINLYYERTFWCILISVSCHSYDFIIVVINSWLCEITSSMVYNFVILFTLHAWYTTLLYFYLSGMWLSGENLVTLSSSKSHTFRFIGYFCGYLTVLVCISLTKVVNLAIRELVKRLYHEILN